MSVQIQIHEAIPPPLSIPAGTNFAWASRLAIVSGASDDRLVAAARRLGIPDPYGLTRARLVEMVAMGAW